MYCETFVMIIDRACRGGGKLVEKYTSIVVCCLVVYDKIVIKMKAFLKYEKNLFVN